MRFSISNSAVMERLVMTRFGSGDSECGDRFIGLLLSALQWSQTIPSSPKKKKETYTAVATMTTVTSDSQCPQYEAQPISLTFQSSSHLKPLRVLIAGSHAGSRASIPAPGSYKTGITLELLPSVQEETNIAGHHEDVDFRATYFALGMAKHYERTKSVNRRRLMMGEDLDPKVVELATGSTSETLPSMDVARATVVALGMAKHYEPRAAKSVNRRWPMMGEDLDPKVIELATGSTSETLPLMLYSEHSTVLEQLYREHPTAFEPLYRKQLVQFIRHILTQLDNSAPINLDQINNFLSDPLHSAFKAYDQMRPTLVICELRQAGNHVVERVRSTRPGGDVDSTAGLMEQEKEIDQTPMRKFGERGRATRSGGDWGSWGRFLLFAAGALNLYQIVCYKGHSGVQVTNVFAINSESKYPTFAFGSFNREQTITTNESGLALGHSCPEFMNAKEGLPANFSIGSFNRTQTITTTSEAVGPTQMMGRNKGRQQHFNAQIIWDILSKYSGIWMCKKN